MVSTPEGFLVAYKPRGPTSFDLVQMARRALGIRKIGHTGTLDPMAEGVLPLCIGSATRVAQYLSDGDKRYEAKIRLGVITDTSDAEGAVIGRSEVPPLTPEHLEAVLAKFRGSFKQLPPMYSAKKVKGERLYTLARKGIEVERASSSVHVSELLLRSFDGVELELSMAVSKGFYVRALAVDIGEALGCGAHLTALQRTQCAGLGLADAIPPEAFAAEGLARLVPVSRALAHIPELKVSEEQEAKVRHGIRFLVDESLEGLFRLVSQSGELLALGEVGGGRLTYRRVLVAQ